MRDKFKNIQKKEFKTTTKKLLLFIFLLYVLFTNGIVLKNFLNIYFEYER